eukprot:Skav201514  [mRNA]  locus=scaffold1154:632989:636980:- [translate_table: standard]
MLNLVVFLWIEAPLQAGSYDAAAVRARIDKEVSSSPVVIYSYSLSPFCSQAKERSTLGSEGGSVGLSMLGGEDLLELLDSLGAKQLGAVDGCWSCRCNKDAREMYTEVVLGPEWIPGLLDAEGAAVRAELGKMTMQTSMPHVFIGGRSVGGLFSGTPGLVPLQEAGELEGKLKAAGAL